MVSQILNACKRIIFKNNTLRPGNNTLFLYNSSFELLTSALEFVFFTNKNLFNYLGRIKEVLTMFFSISAIIIFLNLFCLIAGNRIRNLPSAKFLVTSK